MTIRGLSEPMRLVQSTISGLVTRLERKRLLIRRPNPADHRCARVMLAERVESCLAKDVSEKRLSPLVSVLQQASRGDGARIVDGLTILSKLLTTSSQPTDQPS
jgi:DNA-binding MarR family transcriptional regulator